MSKNISKECKHIIKDKYYCLNCGTICYNNVSKKNYLTKNIVNDRKTF